MRIGLYTETALPMAGGQETVVDALARQFTTLGHDVVVVAPHPRGGLRANDASLPYRVERHYRFVSTRRFLPWYARYLGRLCRVYRFELLHCHSVYPAGYVACRAAGIAHLPVVITSHGADVCPNGRLLAKPGLPQRFRVALQRAGALIAISRSIETRYRVLGGEPARIVRIPNGVDAAALADPAARPRDLGPRIQPGNYFLFLGRLVHRKGADLFLAAAAAAGHRRASLVVAGAGPEEPKLKAQAHQHGLGRRVRFLGHITGDTKTYLLQNALCLVVPSRISEGLPLVVLESYAAGRPVLGTRIPGLEDAIQPGRTGWLVPSDSVPDMARMMDHVAGSPARADQLGREARRYVAECDWGKIAARHVALYESILAVRPQPEVTWAVGPPRPVPKRGGRIRQPA